MVVEYPDHRREFFLYPKGVFPPTDFHSATLIGHEIVLIGSLGYGDLRRVGETQVLKLDTRTLCIEAVATTGELPGWISRHTAEKLSETAILVIGGMIQTPDDYEPNAGAFELDLTTMIWRRREHGDVAVFPISEAVYRKNKNPRYGRANPERSDNPFWLEMARRRWPSSRARLHYGDFAPPQPKLIISDDGLDADLERSKLVRTIDDIVWTAVREDALALTLSDGRKLLIGGEVTDYGDEYADPWVYNDIIVTHADGTTEIVTYPKDVFPHAKWSAGAAMGECVYVFGTIDRERHPDRSRGPVLLRLNTSSHAVAELPVATPPVRVNIYQGFDFRDGNRVVFSVRRSRESEPELCIAFDLETLTWGEPFPRPHAVYG